MCYSRGFTVPIHSEVHEVPFGVFPKISTTVEKTVEKTWDLAFLLRKQRFFSDHGGAKVLYRPSVLRYRP